MKKVIYPAVFKKDKNDYTVEFPDLEGCLTFGSTLEEAYYMAQDALYCYIQDYKGMLPQSTPMEKLKLNDEGIVQLVTPSPYLSEGAKRYLLQEAIEKGLKERRLNKNQVAMILGVDRSYITYIVKGNRLPSQDMAKRIALLLNFDWKLFF